MLYKKNNTGNLDKKLFQNPTSEYRGAPFWAWNCKLDKQEVIHQVDYFKEMGLGGFHVHSRTGLDTEYLGEEFLDIVKACNEKAVQEGMLCWLYDEDRWPSGAGGGRVTQHEQYRSRYLVFTPFEQGTKSNEQKFISSAEVSSKGDGKLLARYEVALKSGYLAHYRLLPEGQTAREGTRIWYAYLEISGPSPWFNNQTYVDTLNPKAIRKFIEETHDKYYKALGDAFSKSVPAIFTDEPQFSHKQSLGFAEELRDVILPYTDDLEETYQAAYGDSLLAHLPELFWELPEGQVSLTRYRYHDHIAERFASSFADTLGNWCSKHNIMLTGHMMEEPTLSSQTRALGETMRSYRGFQLPGIDMLCDMREYTTAKQAQSAAHQFGREGVLSELYGVTNWDFDFRGHKLQGDWQAALGVTVRVPHLSWMSMAGEAKRDYPASIFYQSPWYKEYPLIENHFARLNTALTRGKPHVRVGVLHPVESYWLHFGPNEQTGAIRAELEGNFQNITNWLLFGLVDFDFISESLLPIQNRIESSPTLNVGEMAYETVLVPGCETLRRSTLERLKAFKAAGGEVIFVGEPARYVDAVASDEVRSFAGQCRCIPFSETSVLNAVGFYRDVDIRDAGGIRTNQLFYQMREDGSNRWLFIAQAKPAANLDITPAQNIRISIPGSWIPTLYDTMTGEILPCPAEVSGSATIIKRDFYAHDSLLLLLEPGKSAAAAPEEKAAKVCLSESYLHDAVPVTLSEPNVLLLDMAEYRFDGGAWQPREEILRIDNLFRRKLGYPLRMEAFAQPWTRQESGTPSHTLSLRFSLRSETPVPKPVLALENAGDTRITINGTKVTTLPEGWFVDKSIQKVVLPDLPAGESEIILDIPYASKTNVEWCYLLGDFGVAVAGSTIALTAPVRSLYFGDWTTQGLPFYAGNVTYHCPVKLEAGRYELEASKYRAPLLSVSVDGCEKGKIVFAPYTLDLGKLDEGEHRIDITAFGNRVNAFGAVHNCDDKFWWFGPNAWRTEGSSWAYEYQLKRTGLLISPKVREIETK